MYKKRDRCQSKFCFANFNLLLLIRMPIHMTTPKKDMRSMMHDIIVFVNAVIVFRPRENYKTAFLLFQKYPNMCGFTAILVQY